MRVRARVRGVDVEIERATEHPYDASGDTHLAVHEDTRDPGVLESAEVITRDGAPDDPRFRSPELWTAEVLHRHPHCAAAAYVTGPDTCTVRTRAHGLFRLSATAGGDADPAAYASSLYAWLTQGGTVGGEDGGPDGTTLRVHTATGVHQVTVAPLAEP